MSLGASSSSSTPNNPSLSVTLATSEKLSRDNFLVWQTMVLPDIRGAQLFGVLDGTMPAPDKEIKVTDKDGKEMVVPNPDYARRISLDQCVLGY
jgi:hypothetical protein